MNIAKSHSDLQTLRSTVSRAMHSVVARSFRWSENRSEGTGVFVLPASTPGSLGDAAMLAGLKELLGATQAGRLRSFGYRDAREWVGETAGASAGLVPSSTLDFVRFAKRVRELSVLYVNGADVLDGKYSLERSLQRLHLAKFVAELGRPVTVTGFSLREDVPQAIVRAFRALPHEVRLCARDPRTHARLAARLDRQAVKVADLAFLMKPSIDTRYERDVVERLELARGAGKRLIGLCLNLHAIQREGLDDDQKAEYAVQSMRLAWQSIERRHPDCLPVVLPHDYRGRFNDLVLGERLARETGWSGNAAVVVDQPCSAQALKAFCSRLDVLVTGRMHCGIAALGSGVPAVFFDYQGKVDGLLQLFGLSSSVDASAPVDECARQIGAHVSSFLAESRRIRDQIEQALPTVRELATANLHPLEHLSPPQKARPSH